MSEQKTKVPAQFFGWFESLRQSYENSINKLFNRVEKVNEDHKEQLKSVYQSQIDGLKKSYQDHLQSLKTSNQTQLEQAQARIKQLEKDASFYQEQVKRQNQTIDKLNDRYDAVIYALKDKIDNKELENVIKDIEPQTVAENTETKPTPPTLTHSASDRIDSASATTNSKTPTNSEAPENSEATENTEQKAPESTPEQNSDSLESILNRAFSARQDKHFELAYELFYSAAMLGNEKAMGAIGRAHFVGEGVPMDKTTGLAWLIKAAEHQFEPAIKKVSAAEQKSPDLYQNALMVAKNLV